MNVFVKKPVYRRVGEPSVNASKNGYLEEGTQLKITNIVPGDDVDGNKYWYRDEHGMHYWSGAFEPNSWWLTSNKMRIPEIWKYTKGEGITIAVLDSGIGDHDDLTDAIDNDSAINVMDGRDPKDVKDSFGHGTHCAGIIAGRGKKTVYGVAPASKIIPIKIYDDYNIEENNLLRGLEQAAKCKAQILSISLGNSYLYSWLQNKVNEFLNNKDFPHFIIASIGDTPGEVDYPGALPNIVGVGYAKQIYNSSDLIVGDFSGGGSPGVTIIAPGDKILSCWFDKTERESSGSSMATAYVAGVAALALSYQLKFSVNQKITNQGELINRIKKYTYAAPDNSDTLFYGAGIINPLDFVMDSQTK